jgi:hypothetical protein
VLIVILIILLLLGLLLRLVVLFCRHMMADSAAAGGPQYAMISHVTGDAANDGSLYAALGFSWACRSGCQNHDESGRKGE